jgi:hypothetical protein
MRGICVYRKQYWMGTVRRHPFNDEATMDLTAVPFGTTDWSTVEPVQYAGQTGTAYWRTCQFGSTRVRMVEYSPGYLADHWCWRGHILLCLEGELHTELEDGRQFTLTAGMSYQVGSNAEGHRSFSTTGAKLFIVD